MDQFEQETPYYKGSQRTLPTKADHKHEYIREFAMLRIRRFDGSITSERYKFCKKDTCVDCGYQTRRRNKNAVEVEVTPQEYQRR